MSKQVRERGTVPVEKTLADEMRRRLLRCAELSAFATWLRRQTAEKTKKAHVR